MGTTCQHFSSGTWWHFCSFQHFSEGSFQHFFTGLGTVTQRCLGTWRHVSWGTFLHWVSRPHFSHLYQTLSVNSDPLDLFVDSLNPDMLSLSIPLLQGGVNFLISYKVSFVRDQKSSPQVLIWRCSALGIRNLLAVLHWHLHTLLPRYLLALLGGSATLHWNMAADSLMLHLVMYSLVSLVGLGKSSLFLL